MSTKKSVLKANLTKTLAVTLPVLAMSGFVPGVTFSVESANAEHHGKVTAEAEAKAEGEAKAEAEGEAEAKAEAEGEAEAKAEAYK